MANPTKMKYKVVIIGDAGVGKTSFVKKKLTGQFERKYVATLGVEVHPIPFATNYGDQVINLWDCAGQERFCGMKDGYYIGANGAIIMFDLLSRRSFDHVGDWLKLLRKQVGDIPIVICGNKFDITPPKITQVERSIYLSQPNIIYEDISVRIGLNVEKPLNTLLKEMCGVNDLIINPLIAQEA